MEYLSFASVILIIIISNIMKTKNIFLSAIFIIFSLLGCFLDKDKIASPANDTGSASAKINGVAWNAAWASSLIADFSGTKILTISINLSEKNTSESITIGISSFTGPGTYAYGGDKDKTTFYVRYKGKDYKQIKIAGGGGTGTIKITEYVDSKGLLSPGKVVGEFSGTVKSSDSEEVLTISGGKFTSLKYL
jgi:hypothetical protein